MTNRSIQVGIGALALVLALIPFGGKAFQSNQQPAQPAAASTGAGGRGQPTAQQLAIQQASKEDHQQMMDQLQIASLRPGVNARVTGSTNYDEAKANPFPDLPDPLRLESGKKVTSAKMWWTRRGSSLSAAGQKGSRHECVSSHRDWNPERRSGLSRAPRGAYAQPELALFPRFRRTRVQSRSR